jgi:hypothetical protein
MKSLPFSLTALALAVILPGLVGHAEQPKGAKELMQKKLTNSQKVLEGIALNDFDKIGTHAGELIEVSKAAEWKIHKTPQYELYSNEFRRNAETMVKEAKAKNIDGVTLAYVDLTLTCVKCHKHVREVRMGRRDGPADPERVLTRNSNEKEK